MNDWTSEKSASRVEIIIGWTDSETGEERTSSFLSTTSTETKSIYRTYFYTDSEGNSQSADVVASRFSSTTTTKAQANGAFVSWSLANTGKLPSGSATKSSYTSYSYKTTQDGPRLIAERTVERISELELAGSLNIQDYSDYTPSSDEFESSLTETIFDEYKDGRSGRVYTQSKTTRRLSYGLTQEGQQTASKSLESAAANVAEIVDGMKGLVLDGIEVRSSIGRAESPTRPSGEDLLNDYIRSDDNPEVDGYLVDEYGPSEVGSSSSYEPFESPSASILFGGNTAFPAVETTRLPFAPDTTLVLNGQGVITRIPSGAEQAAREYALMLQALKAGYAYGFNITTSAERLPTTPFSPVYVNAAGLSVATRINGTSWAFDQSGLVVSSDLMLCGVAGRIAS